MEIDENFIIVQITEFYRSRIQNKILRMKKFIK